MSPEATTGNGATKMVSSSYKYCIIHQCIAHHIISECVVCAVVSMWVLFELGGVSGLVLLVKGWHNGSKVSINRTLNCENGPTYTHNVTISLVS